MGFLSSIVGPALSFLGGERANAASAKQAEENREFQERMSSTSHQREVEDLRKAGLNPILSAKYGGASTPAGSMAPMKDTITPAVSTALQYKSMQANVDLLQEQAKGLAYENVGKRIDAEIYESVAGPLLRLKDKLGIKGLTSNSAKALRSGLKPSGGKKITTVRISRDKIDKLTSMSKTAIENTLRSWKKSGVYDKLSKNEKLRILKIYKASK